MVRPVETTAAGGDGRTAICAYVAFRLPNDTFTGYAHPTLLPHAGFRNRRRAARFDSAPPITCSS